jgi:hypothetical protein
MLKFLQTIKVRQENGIAVVSMEDCQVAGNEFWKVEDVRTLVKIYWILG